MQKLEDAKYCILTAAKLISPYIEDTFSAGIDIKSKSTKGVKIILCRI